MYTISVQDPCTLTYKLNVGGKIVFIYLFCFQQVLKKCAREESKIERGIFIFLKTPKLERIYCAQLYSLTFSALLSDVSANFYLSGKHFTKILRKII